MEVNELNRQSALHRVVYEYPYVLVKNPGDPIALVVPTLEPGSLPVLCVVDDVTYKIGCIALTASTVCTLLRVTGLDLYKSAQDVIPLKTHVDVMNALCGIV